MPPVTNETQELEAIRQLFEDHWTDCLVRFPNETAEEPKHLASTDANFPARFIGIEILCDGSPRITFGGTNEVLGRLSLSVWVQAGVSDEALRAVEKLLEAMVRTHGDTYGLQFTGDFTRSQLQEATEEFPFAGRATDFDYVWFREAA